MSTTQHDINKKALAGISNIDLGNKKEANNTAKRRNNSKKKKNKKINNDQTITTTATTAATSVKNDDENKNPSPFGPPSGKTVDQVLSAEGVKMINQMFGMDLSKERAYLPSKDDKPKHTVLWNLYIPPTEKFSHEYIEERVKILVDASNCLANGSPGIATSTFEYEREYNRYYRDIMDHEEVWFDHIYSVGQDVWPVERSTAIIGTLCTVLRQRGNLTKCMKVMDTAYTRILHRYQEHVAAGGKWIKKDNRQCCATLTYKYYRIRLNCGCQLKDKEMAATAFRAIVKHELANDDVENDFAIYLHLGFFSSKNVDKLTDKEICKVLDFGHDISEDINKPVIERRICSSCGKQEKKYGDFAKCARCKEAPYCGKSCQQSDWKIHKIICGAKNTTNIPSSILREISQTIVKNYTGSLKTHNYEVPTDEQQKDALIGLLKLFKTELLGNFHRYNNEFRFDDMARDPEFEILLLEFFGKQPGFEDWVHLNDTYLAHKRSVSEAENVVGEEEIHQYCSAIFEAFVTDLLVRPPPGLNKTKVMSKKLRKEAIVKLSSFVAGFISRESQYDSFKGIEQIQENPDFANGIAKVFGNRDINGVFTSCYD